MPRIIKTILAERDLDEIWLYIALDNPSAADRVLDTIDEKCRLLAAHPHLGRRRDELASGLRSFPVEPHVIFYRSLTDGIEMIRVLHGARDIDSLFHPGEDPGASGPHKD